MNEALKKLRVKLIVVIMAVVTVILSAVFITIAFASYQNSVSEVQRALDDAVKHGLNAQVSAPFDKDPLASDRPVGEDERLDPDASRLEIGGKNPDRSLIPVAVYELESDGSLMLVSAVASGTMTASVLDTAAEQAQKLAEGQGFLSSLGVYYLKETHGDKTLIAFADEQSVSGWRSLALLLLCVELAALVLFFVISLFFSKWVLRPVEASWRQQQGFIADASHELKTPLSVIAADVAILKRHPERSIASQSQWVESIEAESVQMRDLVNDMLLLASADDQDQKFIRETEAVDLSKLVNAQILQFEPLAFERALELSTAIEEGVCVQGDKSKLQRLISVLFDNAFKYVAEQGSITVELNADPEKVRLSVSNLGSPIPAEDLPFIFDRFYRSDKARTRDERQSYGLGLSIAQEIAKQHGGAISVTSDEVATTFTTTLPRMSA